MRLPLVGWLVDERFLEHRRRSTSVAGMLSAGLALVLFLYHDVVDHQLRWELFAVGGLFVLVKLTLLVWYRLKD